MSTTTGRHPHGCLTWQDGTALIGSVRLAELISSHLRTSGEGYRDLERRAKEAGHPISRSRLNTFVTTDEIKAIPSEQTRSAIAAALDVSVEVVTAASLESAGIDDLAADGRSLQHAEAFLRLTEGRTEEEVQHLLGVVTATLRAMEASEQRRNPPPS